MKNIVNKYNEKSETYITQFYSFLDEYKASFVLYHKNPNNQEYRRIFSHNSYILDSINKNLYVLTNDIQKETDVINTKVNNLDKNIKREKQINEDLLFKLQQIKGNDNGALIMNDNSKELYKHQYILNWTMFLGIFFIAYGIYKVFKKE